MAAYDALLKPLTIKHLTIRNRIMGSSHAPAYGKDGKPQERYQALSRGKGQGRHRPCHVRRLLLRLHRFAGVAVEPDLRRRRFRHPLFQAVLGPHPSPWREADVPADPYGPAHPLGYGELACRPSPLPRLREPAHRSFPKEMEDFDIERVQNDLPQRRAALPRGRSRRLRIRLHRPYVDQFLCPATNNAPINMAAASRTACASIWRCWPRRAQQVGQRLPHRHPHHRRRSAGGRQLHAGLPGDPEALRQPAAISISERRGRQRVHPFGARRQCAQYGLPAGAVPLSRQRREARSPTCRSSTPTTSRTSPPRRAPSRRAIAIWSA